MAGNDLASFTDTNVITSPLILDTVSDTVISNGVNLGKGGEAQVEVSSETVTSHPSRTSPCMRKLAMAPKALMPAFDTTVHAAPLHLPAPCPALHACPPTLATHLTHRGRWCNIQRCSRQPRHLTHHTCSTAAATLRHQGTHADHHQRPVGTEEGADFHHHLHLQRSNHRLCQQRHHGHRRHAGHPERFRHQPHRHLHPRCRQQRWQRQHHRGTRQLQRCSRQPRHPWHHAYPDLRHQGTHADYHQRQIGPERRGRLPPSPSPSAKQPPTLSAATSRSPAARWAP